MNLPSPPRKTLLATTIVAGALLAGACVPKESDPMYSDMDGDGVPDALDSCMADPEDFDGHLDEDGCPEKAGPEDAKKAGLTTEKVEDVVAKSEEVKKEETLELTSSTAQSTASLFRKSAMEAVIDEGERNAVVFGFGKGWLYAGGKVTHTIRQGLYRAHFSPEGDKVAIVGTTNFIVADTKTGKLLRKFRFAKGTEDSPETKAIRFSSNDELLLYDGCQLQRASATGRSTPTPIGERKCGRPRIGMDGQRWFIWQQEDEAIQVHQVDVSSGKTSLALGGEGDAPGLSMLIASPDGKHLCYSRHRDASEFSCRNVETKKEMALWEGPTDKTATFTNEGMLVFGAGKRGSDERPLMVVNLDSREVFRAGELSSKEKWMTPIGNNGVVASGGPRLLRFDFDAKTRQEIKLDKGEWEGLSLIPGKEDEYVIGKERKGSRDLFRIVVK